MSESDFIPAPFKYGKGDGINASVRLPVVVIPKSQINNKALLNKIKKIRASVVVCCSL